MSRLSKDVSKPFTKTLQWKNEKFDKKLKKVTQEKGWYYHVKSEVEGEKGTNVMVEMPFTFVWLSNATSFTGFNEAKEIGIFSNEVLNERHLKEICKREGSEGIDEYTQRIRNYQVITAKMGKEEIAKGFYKDIKSDVVALGGKYCQPNYVLLVTNDGTEIVRMLMSGSSVETWIPFADQAKLRDSTVSCNGSIDKQKGSNDYCSPTFNYVSATKELLQEADKAAVKMDEYFKFILSNNTESQETVPAGEHEEEDYTK